jgi:hypothetical protein
MVSVQKILVYAAVITLLVGCSQYEARLPETGATLEGTVTYGDQKIPLAMITVFGEKGQAHGQIEEPGRYAVENVPLGEVKIGVNTEAVRSQVISQQMAASYKGPGSKGRGARPPAPSFVSLPAKLQDPETSGITTTIKKGANQFDIVLTPTSK